MRQLGAIVLLCGMASAVSTYVELPCQPQLRRRLQETATPYAFNISLALEYLEPAMATQLESADITNEVVSHFCNSVNTQVRSTLLSAPVC